MHYEDIIIAPVITEKSSIVNSNGKTYVFKVFILITFTPKASSIAAFIWNLLA